MADRYWVLGTGTWDATSTTNWSASSGGTGGASVPTAADNVFFDVNSNVGTDAFTVTMATTPRVCNDFTASGLDGVMTLAGSAIGLTVSGSLTFPATNFTRTYTGTTTFNATTTGKTVTTNGVTVGIFTFNGVGGGWTLGSAFNTTSTLTVTNGTFDTSSSGNYSITASQLASSNSNIRTINLNASTVTLSSISTPWDITTSTNATLNAGTSTINCSANSPSFAGGGLTYYNVAFTSSAKTVTSITGANAFNNLSITGQTTVGLVQLSFSANQTINGTFTVSAGTASAYRISVFSNTFNTPRTLTCAAVSFTDTDFRDITIAGAASPASGTRLGNAKGNSGITFTTAKTVFYRQTGSANWAATGTGSWSATSGGSADATMFPLPQDTAVFPAATYPASGSTTTINGALFIGTIDMSLRTSNTMTLANGSNACSIFGNWINGTGITLSGTGLLFFYGQTTQTITSAGRSFTQPIAINSVGGTVRLQDALTTGTTNTTTLTRGTLDLQSYTFSTGVFSSPATGLRTIAFGTGNISCTGTGTVWNTNVTFSTAGLTTTGTQIVNVTSVGSTPISVFNGIASEANSISFNFTGGTYFCQVNDTSGYTARNINFTGFAGQWYVIGSNAIIYGDLTLSSGMTLYATTNTLVFGATSGTKTITSNGKTMDFPITFNGVGGTFQLQDALTMGSTRTATLTNGTLDLQSYTLSTGLFSSSNSTTRTIAFGTGNITCTGTGTVWTTATVTGLTTTGTQVVNVTSVGSTAITVSTGVLSEANSISYNFTGGTYVLTFLDVTNYSARNVDFTGFSGTLGDLSDSFQAPVIIYGNLTLSATMTLTASTTGNGLRFGKTSGTINITTNAKVIPFILTFNGVGGTFVLQDNLTTSGATSEIYFNNGTLDLNGKTLTPGSTFITGIGTKNLTFNGGTLVCSLGVSSAFNNLTPTGFTTTAGTGIGTISMTAATAKTFVGGGSTFNCTLNQGGAGALTITGSNTFRNITNTVQPAAVLFTAGTTNTFTNFSLSGTAGNLVTVGSSTAASHTLSAGGTVSADYLSISQSTAAGGAGWYAGANSTNGGNNSGWVFTAPPAPTYSVSGPGSIGEGGVAGFIVTATNVVNGTILYWTLTPTSGATSADFSTTSGSFPINSNSGLINVNTVADFTTEGTQGFFVSVRTVSISGTVVQNSNVVSIIDTSLTPVTATGNFLVFF